MRVMNEHSFITLRININEIKEKIKMEPVLIAPAKFFIGFFPTAIISLLLPIVGVGLFTYIMAKRIAPLVKAAPDNRFGDIPSRIVNVAARSNTPDLSPTFSDIKESHFFCNTSFRPNHAPFTRVS